MTATTAAQSSGPRASLISALRPITHYFTRPIDIARTYDRADFRPDLVAGITVAVILLPQAIAFALIAELPPQMGLYTAIVGGLAGALWGSSNQNHSGPANAISLLILSTLSAVALPGTPEYIIAAGMLALMIGIFQILLGLARLGVLVNFVSHSVIVGFASGAGVLILIRQIPPLLGLDYPAQNMLETTLGIFYHFPESNIITAAIGIGTMIFLVVAGRLRPNFPATLVVMFISAFLVYIFSFDKEGVAVIGSLPKGLPPLAQLPITDTKLISQLLAGTIAVGAIGLVETTAIAKSVANHTRQRLDSNQEFFGQGMANALSGIFSGFPGAGSFSRTAVNYRAGAKTPLAAALSSVFVLVAMQFLGPVTAYLPRSALAGVLIVTAYRMVDTEEMARILRGSWGDALIMVVTFLGTLFLPIETAVLIGIILSFLRYIIRTSTPRVHAVVPDEEHSHFVFDPDRPQCPQLGVIEILGDLYFGAVNHVEDFILDHAAGHPQQRYLLIRMHNVNNCDFSGIHMLESVLRTYRDRGGDVFLVRVSFRVLQRMEKTGFDIYLGQENFLNEDTVVSQLFYHVLDPAVCIYECPFRVFTECKNLPKRLDLIGLTLDNALTTAQLNTIPPRELWKTITDVGEVTPPVVIDVREPREFRKGHIPGARSVPLPLIASIQQTLPHDQEIILACRSGRRSRQAAAILQNRGQEKITIVEGGMLAWEAAGLLEAVETFDNGES